MSVVSQGINQTSNSEHTGKPALLQLRDAQVQRSGHIILDIDELSIKEGASIAILGPNGAGKTTFVNLVTREVFPLYKDEPPVVFRGDARMTLADAKKCTGVVSASMQQQIKVHLPALDIVLGGLFGSLGIPLRQNPSKAQRQLALEALDRLGIADLAKRDVMTLSSGQARRVLVARAIVHNPDILVFDEPCSGLDPQGIYFLRHTMNEFAHEGRSILLVTHYPEDIVSEIDDVFLLKDGKIFARGPKKEVLTSEYMSSLFEVPLTISEKNGRYRLDL